MFYHCGVWAYLYAAVATDACVIVKCQFFASVLNSFCRTDLYALIAVLAYFFEVYRPACNMSP